MFLFCGLFWKIKSDDLSWFVLSILLILLIKYRWSYIIHTFEICQEMFVIYYWFMKLNHYTIITIKERTRHDGLMSSDPIRSKHRSTQSWHPVSRYIASSCIIIVLFSFFSSIMQLTKNQAIKYAKTITFWVRDYQKTFDKYNREINKGYTVDLQEVISMSLQDMQQKFLYRPRFRVLDTKTNIRALKTLINWTTYKKLAEYIEQNEVFTWITH